MSSSPSTNPFPPGPPPLTPPVPDDYADPGARAIDLSTRPVADSLREIMASSPRLPKPQPPPLPQAVPGFLNRHWTLAGCGLLAIATSLAMAGESVWHLVIGGLDGLAQDPPERARLLVVNPMWTAWLLWLGLGLILARRWARALSLACLFQGFVWALVSALAITVNNAPDFGGELSPYDTTAAWECLSVLAVAAVLSWLSLSILGHRNVRLTCERAQPHPDWTDRHAPSEWLLTVLLLGMTATWAGLATYHPWPCWGVWRSDHIPWVWGGAALAAALGALLVARGRLVGAWIALTLTALSASSVLLTALRQPVDACAPLWDDWALSRRGGLAFTLGKALVLTCVAVAALHARRRRQSPPTTPAATP